MQTHCSRLIPAFEPEITFEIPELTVVSEEDLRFQAEMLLKNLAAESTPVLRPGIPLSSLKD